MDQEISVHRAHREQDKLLAKDVSKQRITQEQATEARNRLQPTINMEDLKDVDFVIEAVPVRVIHCNLV